VELTSYDKEMNPEIGIGVRAIPLGFVLLGLIFAAVASLTPISPRKGLLRLIASGLVGAAFVEGSIVQMFGEHRLWPAAFGIGAGAFLAWIGYRKYKRDPDGHTAAAQML
jgi:hypothetical protein